MKEEATTLSQGQPTVPQDQEIVDLLFARDEAALSHIQQKYARYCHRIAENILGNHADAEECVNDTWLGAWNAMPPHRPEKLSVFLGRITRNLALNRCRYNNAQKRSSELREVLVELADCADPQYRLEQKELTAALNAFLQNLPQRKRCLFLQRYWYAQPIGEIARQRLMTQGAVTMQLKRLRAQLRTFLMERGMTI